MKTLPYKVETSEDGGKSTVHFPGISYLSSGPSGILSPWGIVKCMEAGRVIRIYPVSSNLTTFMIEQTFDFNWENITCAKQNVTFPYTITLDLAGIGRTSLQWKQTMVNSLDGSCLATGLVRLVLVDPTSRRPREIPPEFKENRSHLVKLSFPIIDVPEIPGVHFCLPFTVLYSDTDRNRHLNQASFVKHAYNCVWKANRIDPFHSFRKDIGEQPLINISILYKGEALEGDQLVCSCWQDKIQLQHIHAVITNNKRVLAYFKMAFDVQAESKL
ncbi:uncharacterized protein LOC121387812 isoform X2 [Gigantopelta aegis]|uniref:uncharacterized protein LOC121387812 isoform X2 n=1 Tax=Gigantopelta aegis TaxID=1735272 RepID=UPI001B888259|nr:uncharacterized protein LOC121387812 isoform X2 [Gigantopelta aegis]